MSEWLGGLAWGNRRDIKQVAGMCSPLSVGPHKKHVLVFKPQPSLKASNGVSKPHHPQNLDRASRGRGRAAASQAAWALGSVLAAWQERGSLSEH